MKQYIDKSTLVAEIERLIDKGKYNEEYYCAYRDGNNSALYALKEIINTLEVKEVNLEEELADFLEKENAYIDDNSVISYYNGSSFNHTYDIYPLAKHFFELGLKAKGE